MARPAGLEISREAWEDILELNGTSLTKVAELADIPRSTLSSLLGGHHRASIPMAHRISGAAGCRPATLFPELRGSLKAAA